MPSFIFVNDRADRPVVEKSVFILCALLTLDPHVVKVHRGLQLFAVVLNLFVAEFREGLSAVVPFESIEYHSLFCNLQPVELLEMEIRGAARTT